MIFIKVLYQQGEEEAEIVRIRLEGVGVDLHQSDARFHKNLCNTFTSVRNITAAQKKSAVTDHEQDKAIEEVVSAIRQHAEKVWSYRASKAV